LMATLTAWAQNVQSMPRTFNCTRRSSADAADGSDRINNKAAALRMIRFMVSVRWLVKARKST